MTTAHRTRPARRRLVLAALLIAAASTACSSQPMEDFAVSVVARELTQQLEEAADDRSSTVDDLDVVDSAWRALLDESGGVGDDLPAPYLDGISDLDGDGKDDDARLTLVVGEHRATVVLSGRQAALD
jgi:hypothetical protein